MAARGVNKVILLGNLGGDPEARSMQNGDTVVNFSVATSEVWKDNTGAKQERTEWHRCVAFRKLADIIVEYLRKGSKVYLEGKLQTRKWQDKEGNDRYSTEIVVDELQMLGDAPGGDREDGGSRGGSRGSGSAKRGGTKTKAQPQETEQADFDDDIPF